MASVRTRSIAASVALAAVASLVYLFLWGKLFLYSPVVLGFSRHELSRVVIYVQNGANQDGCDEVDAYLPAVEIFHDLKFKKKPRVFVFRDRASYLRRTTTKARVCAYPNGSLVVSPWALQEAAQGTISLETYLKHELSHTLLYQNMGIWPAYVSYPRWLLEGIAMYSANQMGTSWYPGKAQTYAGIEQGDFMPPFDYKTRREDKVPLRAAHRIAFIYSEFGCIIDYLIESHGRERFLRYMKELTVDPDHDEVFRRVYGTDFESFLLRFKEHVRESVQRSVSPGAAMAANQAVGG